MTHEPTVFIVDDDADVLHSLGELVLSAKLPVRTFDSAESFLDGYEPGARGCLVLDIRMQGMSGLELQEKLSEAGDTLPIIILTGHADVPMVVRTMRMGAVDFLQKPTGGQVLLDRIRSVLERDATLHRRREIQTEAQARLSGLTSRERQVLDLIVAGKNNKGMAAALGLSHKTIEYHRGKIMVKMQAATVADLVRSALEVGMAQ